MNLFLLILAAVAALAALACEKHCEEYMQVEINFLDESHTVTFTGEQGQGSFTITPTTPIMSLPANGTYAVCINFAGGCPARLYGANGSVVHAWEPGTHCANGLTLEPHYNLNTQCE